MLNGIASEDQPVGKVETDLKLVVKLTLYFA